MMKTSLTPEVLEGLAESRVTGMSPVECTWVSANWNQREMDPIFFLQVLVSITKLFSGSLSFLAL